MAGTWTRIRQALSQSSQAFQIVDQASGTTGGALDNALATLVTGADPADPEARYKLASDATLAGGVPLKYTAAPASYRHRRGANAGAPTEGYGVQAADTAFPASLTDALSNTMVSNTIGGATGTVIQPTALLTIVDFDVLLLSTSAAAATCTVRAAFYDSIGFTLNNGTNTLAQQWVYGPPSDAATSLSLTTQAVTIGGNTYYLAHGRLSVDTGGTPVYAAVTAVGLPASPPTWAGIYVNATLRA